MPIKDRFRVNSSARRTITLVFSLTLFAALAISYAPAADVQYLYCWTANLRTGSDQMFFSRVFPGDVSQRGPMQIAFQKYVNENYQDSNPGPGACKNYSSRRDAESDLALDLKEKRDFEKQQVVETGWTFHAKTNTTKVFWSCSAACERSLNNYNAGGPIYLTTFSTIIDWNHEGEFANKYISQFVQWAGQQHPELQCGQVWGCLPSLTKENADQLNQEKLNTCRNHYSGCQSATWSPQ
jgi:hypothetical protein